LSSATAGAAVGAVGGVTVNGVRYDDSNATYADDLGAVLTAGQIGLGMMVAVEGDVDSGGSSGVARRIVVMDDIVAPLVDVDLVGRTVTVPGARAQVGATTVLVLTGYGRGELEYRSAGWKTRPDHIAEDLMEAVEWILSREANAGETP